MQQRIDMTYQGYLARWVASFGAVEYAYTHCSLYGYTHAVYLQCLSEAEFTEHLTALNEAMIEFEEANRNGSIDGMDTALFESFPHEVVLLL
jgi:hypothetical protein